MTAPPIPEKVPESPRQLATPPTPTDWPAAGRLRLTVGSHPLLPRLLPIALEGISITRSQILVNQLRMAVAQRRGDDIVVAIVTSVPPQNSPEPTTQAPPTTCNPNDSSDLDTPPDVPLRVTEGAELLEGLVIAMCSPHAPGLVSPPTATILMATPVQALAEWDAFGKQKPRTARLLCEPFLQSVGGLLASGLDGELRKRGVRFVQWAQDPAEQHPASDWHNTWSSAIGFQRIADLEYLRFEVPAPARPRPSTVGRPVAPAADPTPEPPRLSDGVLTLLPVDRAAADGQIAETAWDRLVDRTYEATLDCPDLSSYHTSRGILDGYRSSPAFSPELWFEAFAGSGEFAGIGKPPESPVGCLILARHGLRPSSSSRTSLRGQASGMLELVYMGVVPEHRGRGYGARLVEFVKKVAEREGCDSILLAVDGRNAPSVRIYLEAGFSHFLHEVVWAKRLASPLG